MRKLATAGFTFIEILVVMAVISIVTVITAETFQNWSRAEVLKISAQEIHTALIDAQSKTIGSRGDTVYGVHIEDSMVVSFTGGTYNAGESTNITYVFDKAIVATSSLAGEVTEVVFSRLTSEADVEGTITVTHSITNASTTIQVYSSGLIEYE